MRRTQYPLWLAPICEPMLGDEIRARKDLAQLTHEICVHDHARGHGAVWYRSFHGAKSDGAFREDRPAIRITPLHHRGEALLPGRPGRKLCRRTEHSPHWLEQLVDGLGRNAGVQARQISSRSISQS